MITSFEVGSVFTIVDKATPTISRISKAVGDLGKLVAATKKDLQALNEQPFAKLSANLKTLTDRFTTLQGSIDKATGSLTSTIDAAAISARNLAQQLTAASAAARGLGSARIPVAGGGAVGSVTGGAPASIRSRANAGRLGFGHLAGNIPVGSNAHFRYFSPGGGVGGNAALAGALGLGYGVFREMSFEDSAFQAEYLGQIPANQRPQVTADLRKLLQQSSATTGAPISELQDAALAGIRLTKGLPWDQRMTIMRTLMDKAAAEARLKHTSPSEAMSAIVGMAHMAQVYDPNSIAKYADLFGYLSTADTRTMTQMERAAGYAVPILKSGLNINPAQTLVESTILANAGILNTKSGTWIREMAQRAAVPTRKTRGDLQQLGLLDASGNITWKDENGQLDILKMLQIASGHLQNMSPEQRAKIETEVFGKQGAGAFSVLSSPNTFARMQGMTKESGRFTLGEKFWEDYTSNSPLQQTRKTFADLSNVLMDIGRVALPPVVGLLQTLDSWLKTIKQDTPSFLVPKQGSLGSALGKGMGAGAVVGGIGGSVVPGVGTVAGAAGGAFLGGAYEGLKWLFGGSTTGDPPQETFKKGTEEGSEKGAEKGVIQGFQRMMFQGGGIGSGGGGIIPAMYTTGTGGGGGGRSGVASDPGSSIGRIPNAGAIPMGPVVGGGITNLMHGQFGAPGTNLVRINAGGKSFVVNKAAAPYFQGFVSDLAAAGAPINSIYGYNYRNIAGTGHISQHAYGNAIDIDQQSRNIAPALHAWAMAHPQQFRAILRKNGIVSGGDWRHPDFGHFEWGGGKAAAIASDIGASISGPSPAYNLWQWNRKYGHGNASGDIDGTSVPHGHDNDVHIHNVMHLDGRKISENTSKHIVRHGNSAMMGGRMSDMALTRPFPV